MAAVLACGDDAVLSHRSAAALWGIRRPGGHAIEVTAPSKTRSRGNLRRHSSALPADEVTTHDGIPVTTVPRTLFDLAAISSTDVVEFGLKESEYLGHYDALSLRDLVDRYPGRRGVSKAKACLDRHRERPVGRVRSPLEERFVPFLRRHRLPQPQLNAWIDLGDKRFQVDCLWLPHRQIVELDGWEGHGTRVAFRDDRARDRRLRVGGYGVTRLTWAQLDDEAAQITKDLRALLADQP
jgi:very-short-patch-repair endonuclease